MSLAPQKEPEQQLVTIGTGLPLAHAIQAGTITALPLPAEARMVGPD